MAYKKGTPKYEKKAKKGLKSAGRMGSGKGKSPAQLVHEKKLRQAPIKGKPLPKKKKIPKKPLRKPLKSRNLAKRKKK